MRGHILRVPYAFLAVLWLWCIGCSGSSSHEVITPGSSTGLAFANLGGDGKDLLVLSRDRGILDAFANENGEWKLTGNFFTGGEPVSARGAMVDGQHVVVVLNRPQQSAEGTIALLPSDPDRAHVLRFPVALASLIQAMTVFDINEDGSDDVVYISRHSVSVLYDLKNALTANDPLRSGVHSQVIDSNLYGVDLTVADVNRDTKLDLIVLQKNQANARVYFGPFTFSSQGRGITSASIENVMLPEEGRNVFGAECTNYPAFVVSKTGAWVGITGNSSAESVPIAFAPVQLADLAGNVVVTFGGANPDLRISDACSTRRGDLVSSSVDVIAVALGHRDAKIGSSGVVATLSSAGSSVLMQEVY